MKKYYPINIDLAGERCLVVGGGKVAERKVERLVQFGADIKVVSPELTERLKSFAKRRTISYAKRKFSKAALKNTRLVFALTNDPAANRKIADESKKRGLWVNVAKPGGSSNFILPAVINRQDLTVSISTQGSSPKRAKQVRKKLEALL